jgi:hypothetical protein
MPGAVAEWHVPHLNEFAAEHGLVQMAVESNPAG